MSGGKSNFDSMFGCEFRYVEWVIVAWAYLWAFWLICMVDMERDAYRLMRDMVRTMGLDVVTYTPYVWGGYLIVAGSILMAGLYLDRLAYRKVALFFLTVYWVGVALTLGIHNFYSTAFATYTPLAVLVLLAYMRLAFKSV